MWKVAMSEEVGKALQSVVDRVNQAAARRLKVTAAREAPLRSSGAPLPARSTLRVRESRCCCGSTTPLCKAAKHLNLWMGVLLSRACEGSAFITPCMGIGGNMTCVGTWCYIYSIAACTLLHRNNHVCYDTMLLVYSVTPPPCLLTSLSSHHSSGKDVH